MATISQCYSSEPEFGPEITPDKSSATKRRVLLGWNHTNDTHDGLREGKIWCWVTEGNHLQVFDQNFNRSKIPGVVKDCGVTNFTVVRMFHGYWCRNGQVPRDMIWEDKKECRYRYKQLVRGWRIRNDLPVDDDLANPIQPRMVERVRWRGRPRGSGLGRSVNSLSKFAPLRDSVRTATQFSLPVTGTLERLSGHGVNEPFYVTDSDDDNIASPTSSTQRRRAGSNDSVFAAISGYEHDNNKIVDRKMSRVDETLPDIHEILNNHEPPRARAFTRVDIDPFKRSPAPRYYPYMIESSLRGTEAEPARSDIVSRITPPLESSGATILAGVQRGTSASPAMPTIELSPQRVKDHEDDEMVLIARFPAMTKPEVIVLDD